MRIRYILLVYGLLLVSAAASAQQLATIVGTVTDPTGAAIPGVSVKVSNPTKGFTNNCVSNSAGEYTAANIPIGEYLVTAEVTGFAKLTRSGITLDAGQTLRVDLQLKVGTTREQVNVVGNLPKVETENAAISNVITGTQISELSIQARNFLNLCLLVPGAAPLGYGYDPNTVGDIQSGEVMFNGLPGNMSNYEIDGSNDVEQGSGAGSFLVYPSLDSIAEFRISTSNYSAEFARSGSAQIEVATKSGTSQFHGSAFDFVRNSMFDSNNWFLNRQIAPPGGNAPKQPIHHNDFGFTIGGPFYIPGLYNSSKQKTFFFVSEEWRRYRDGTVINAVAPSVLERQGDFSQCDPTSPNFNASVASGCVLPTNPATGQVFANDTVPVDPSAQTLISSLVPLPNNGIIGYTKAPNLPTNFREDSIRVDQNISDKARLFVRFTQDGYDQVWVPTLWESSNFATVKTSMNIPCKNAVLNLTNSIRPNLMNEVILSYSSDVWIVTSALGTDSPSGTIAKPAGFGVKPIFPAANPILPGIWVCGGGPCFGEDTGYGSYWYWAPGSIFKDNLVWTRGRHTLKMGVFFFYNRINNIEPQGASDSNGVLSFYNWSSITTGNGLADMYLGRIGSYTQDGHVVNAQLVGGFGAGHYRQEDFETYFQDDWRVNSRLTLNFGIRYYFETPFKDHTIPSVASIFDPGQYNPADQAQLNAYGSIVPGTGADWLNYGNGLDACGVAPIPKGCIKLPHDTPAPRLGFAWDPTGTGKTSIRGGYALMYDTSNSHFTSAGRFGNAPNIGDLAAYNINGFANIVPGAIGPVSTYSQPLFQHLPQLDQYSLGIQHEFPGNNLLSVSYVGTLGRHLERQRNPNQVPIGAGTEYVPELAGTTGCDAVGNCNVQDILIHTLEPSIFFTPFRGYNNINQMENSGISNYNSLQVNYRHTFGHGLTLQGLYTWGHTIDDLIANGSTIDDYDLSRWYGTSAFNQTQVLVLNYVYNLPFFAHSTNHFMRHALGGWQIEGITTFETGPPIGLGCGIAGMASGTGGGVMCNSSGKVGVKKGVVDDPQFGPTPTWFDPGTIAEITVPQLSANNEPGMFGYMGKYAMRGPGRNNSDMGLTKNFELPWFNGEHSTLQFRWENFNAFNHPQWQYVNIFCSNVTPPGEPCNGANNVGNAEVASAYNPRIMQLALRFVF